MDGKKGYKVKYTVLSKKGKWLKRITGFNVDSQIEAYVLCEMTINRAEKQGLIWSGYVDSVEEMK